MRRSILVTLLLFICCLSFGQTEGKSDSLSRIAATWRMQYRPGEPALYGPGNELLKEMAREVLREPWLVNLRARFGLTTKLGRDSAGQDLSIAMTPPVMEGDNLYRKFPIRQFLVPSQIRLAVRWANRADTSGFSEQVTDWLHIPKVDSLLCRLPAVNYDPQVDTVMVRVSEMAYDSAAVAEFMARTVYIHDYYASVALLDSLALLEQEFRVWNPAQATEGYLAVEEINAVMKVIGARDFPSKLIAEGGDPAGFAQRYREMYRLSRTLLYNYIDNLTAGGAISWDHDAGRLADYFTNRVLSYVRRSYLMDQLRGEVYRDCLNHLFDETAFPAESGLPGKLYIRLFPGANSDTVTAFLVRRICSSYESTAAKLIANGDFAAAFSLLDNRRRFAAAVHDSVGCSPETALETRAAEGIFTSYVGIAESCMNTGKFAMADTYLEKARRYSVQQSRFVRSDSAYRALFSALFFMRNKACDETLEKGEWAEALACYQQFEQLYPPEQLRAIREPLAMKMDRARAGLSELSARKSNEALAKREPDTALFYYNRAKELSIASQHASRNAKLDTLAPVMARIRFDQLKREGADALDMRRYTLAVQLFRTASGLADSAHLDRGRVFDSLYRSSMKNYVIVQLWSRQKQIWANRFDSARATLEWAGKVAYHYGFSGESDYISALDRYGKAISEQQCRILADSVEVILVRADRSLRLRNYPAAVASLRQALAMARPEPGCQIDTLSLTDTLNRYIPPAGYQSGMARVGGAVAVGEYKVAFETLERCQAELLSARLATFGLKSEGVPGYVRSKSNPYFSRVAAEICLDRGDAGEAWNYLVMTRDLGLDASTCAALQTKLGELLAKREFTKGNPEASAEKLKSRGADGAWFAAFAKSYLETWKQLDRKP